MIDDIAIVYSLQDSAGKNIVNELKKLNSSLPVYSFDEDSIFIDLKDIKEEIIIFVSKHQSKAGKKSLTCHSIGNFGKAEVGGKDKTLVPTKAKLLGNFVRGLNEKKEVYGLDEYEVCYEVTHHGPYSEKSCLFIEAGGTEKEWSDLTACKAIAETIISGIEKENEDIIVIGFGGGHYAPEFTKASLRNNYSFGHICPKYNLENLNMEMVNEMIKKSKAKEIVLDWKGLGKEKDRINELCENTGLPIRRVRKLKKN